MQKEIIKKRLNDIEIKTGIIESGVKILLPEKFIELKKKNRLSKNVKYIIDDIR